MSTPINFFLDPSNFKDQNNATPPAIYGDGAYHAAGGSDTNSPIILTSVKSPNPGDFVALDMDVQEAGTRLTLAVSGVTVFDGVLAVGQQHVEAANLTGDSTVTLTITPPASGQYYVHMVPGALQNNGDATVANFAVSGNSLVVACTDQSTAKNGTTISTWSWDFGDGTTPVTTQNASHTYTSPGAYSITLTVTDSTGTQASTVHNVSVANPPPVGADTYSVKAFSAFGSMANNTPGVVATLGELSVRSETYAKDRLLFSTTAGTGQSATAVNLSVFSSKKADGSDVGVPADYATSLLTLCAWIYTQSVAGQFNNNAASCQQQIVAEFSGTIKDVTVGVMLQQGSQWMPEYVVFHFNNPSSTGGDFTTQSRVKVWFADASFGSEYDEYVIEFVPPLPGGAPLDDFFKPSAQVVAEVNSFTLDKLMEQIQIVAGKNPYTLAKTLRFDYHDPNDVTFTYPTNWTFVIYGAAGDNVDALKAGLIDYILSHSTHSREDWSKIFPDIFTATEFLICPLWNQYAIPNKDTELGVYSPTVNLVGLQALVPSVFIGTRYTSAHVTANTDVTGVPYKSLALAICGGPENRNGISRFGLKWPDYLAVPTTSLDFNRMSPQTQQWIGVLYNLLNIAEDMTEFSDIPIGYTRLKRTNAAGQSVLYVVTTFDNVQYLVVAKDYLMKAFPPPASLSLVSPASSSVTGPVGGGPMTATFVAGGGTAPYQYTLAAVDSRIPNGKIDPVSGKFTGTLPSWGNYSISVKVLDAQGNTYTGNYTLVSLASGT